MSELYVPESLKYGATYSQSKINRLKVLPTTGAGPYGPNAIIRFALPSRSILRLSSVSVVADLSIKNLISSNTATQVVNAMIPYTQKLVSRCNWIVNGVSCTPSNHYDQVSCQLSKLTASENWVKTRCSQGALDLIQHTDDAAETAGRKLDAWAASEKTTVSKTSQIVIDDFLGVSRGNSGYGILDCGVFGNCELELTLNSDPLKVWAGSGASAAELAAVTYELSNISLQVDAIVSVSNDYLQMMSMRLKDSRPINYAFQNFNCQIQSHGGTGVVRHSVNTNCLDIVMAAPLESGYATRTSQTSTNVNPPRYKYNSGRSHADQKNAQIQFSIGSTQYPQGWQMTAFEGLDISQNCFGINDRYANNLLCYGTDGFSDLDSGSYIGRSEYLTNNAIVAFPLSNESEGWASPNRILSGISTNQANGEIVFSLANFGTSGGFLVTTALYTSVLQYDPASATVSLIQ
jgi:hypothetical protein